MKILAFSDLHNDRGTAARLVERSGEADLVIGAGDFASQHRGLEKTIAALSAITAPTLLVPGNNESEVALRGATEGWESATVLHGETAEIDGHTFFGLGAGIPTTPWGWSFDLNEEEATEMLEPLPAGATLILHSPPYGHCDQNSGGTSLGSASIAAAIEAKQPALVLCGHIHESWGARSEIGSSAIANLGPDGTEFELD